MMPMLMAFGTLMPRIASLRSAATGVSSILAWAMPAIFRYHRQEYGVKRQPPAREA
jgi:hypothetical protein